MRAVEELPDDKAAEVVQFAESLGSQEPRNPAPPTRHLGFCRGQIRIDPSFFDPFPDEVLDAFEGRGNGNVRAR